MPRGKVKRVQVLVGTRKGAFVSFSTDEYHPAGLDFGTETGQLFYSSNVGSQWRLLANFLPPILSVETALV